MQTKAFAKYEGSTLTRQVSLLILTATCFTTPSSLAASHEGQKEDSSSPRAQRSPATNNLLEQFKAFIACPPVLSNLVWEEKVPMDGFRPLDGSLARSTKFDYFQAKWQTNGLLFRRLGAPNDVTSFVTYELVSWSGHQHAVLDRGLTFTTWDDRDASIPSKPISVFDTGRVLRPLRQILNLGIMDAEIGSVRWDGNNFWTECEVDSKPMRITGSVIPSGEGPPQAMLVSYADEDRTNRYLIRYGYASCTTNFEPPVAITNFWLGNYHQPRPETDLGELRMLVFEPSAEPLGPQAFDVAPFVDRNRRQWLTSFYTNGGVYYLGKSGTPRLLYALKDFNKGSKTAVRVRPRMTLLYACWAGMNIAIFALIARAREDNKSN